jgi:dienelactone hydrolase
MKKPKIIAFVIIALIVLSAGFIVYTNLNNTRFSLQMLETNSSYSEEKVIFSSHGKDIYGLLIVPKQKVNVPAIIVLPAAAGTKESREWYGQMFLEMGYATLILDQRGIGETDGQIVDLQKDYEAYRKNEAVFQNLFIEDVINAVNVLLKIKGIDKDRIAVLGESMGGRYAIIAAAEDKRLKASFIISSSGFRVTEVDYYFNQFVASINPNEYISKISPRRVVMFHSDNDTVITLEDAQFTYSRANEPKEFVLVNGCEHGYCDKMYEKLKSNLKLIFKK